MSSRNVHTWSGSVTSSRWSFFAGSGNEFAVLRVSPWLKFTYCCRHPLLAVGGIRSPVRFARFRETPHRGCSCRWWCCPWSYVVPVCGLLAPMFVMDSTSMAGVVKSVYCAQWVSRVLTLCSLFILFIFIVFFQASICASVPRTRKGSGTLVFVTKERSDRRTRLLIVLSRKRHGKGRQVGEPTPERHVRNQGAEYTTLSPM